MIFCMEGHDRKCELIGVRPWPRLFIRQLLTGHVGLGKVGFHSIGILYESVISVLLNVLNWRQQVAPSCVHEFDCGVDEGWSWLR